MTLISSTDLSASKSCIKISFCKHFNDKKILKKDKKEYQYEKNMNIKSYLTFTVIVIFDRPGRIYSASTSTVTPNVGRTEFNTK